MQGYDGSAVLGAIRSIRAAATPRETLLSLAHSVGRYGFEQIYLGQLIDPDTVPLKDILYLSHWPDAVKARRERQMALLFDPISIAALRARRPFRWAEAPGRNCQPDGQFADRVHDDPCQDGMMFPMHALHSVSGGVSLSAERLMELSERQLAELEILCQTAYYRFDALLGPVPYQKLARRALRNQEGPDPDAVETTPWELMPFARAGDDRSGRRNAAPEQGLLTARASSGSTGTRRAPG